MGSKELIHMKKEELEYFFKIALDSQSRQKTTLCTYALGAFGFSLS
jgi:hypothetical protein